MAAKDPSFDVYTVYADIIALSRAGVDATLGDWLVVAPVATALIGSALLVIVGRSDKWQPILAGVLLGFIALFEFLLFLAVQERGLITMRMSDWAPPFGIVFAVDLVGASFGLAAAIAALACLVFASKDVGRSETRFGFYPLMVMLMAGVLGAFHTGDLFNLYVWFEVLLISSFGLIVLGGTPLQLDGALRYCVLNLLATTVFLIATGLLYGSLGTLNFADIARRMAAPDDNMPVATIATLFVFGFAMKAAAFPMNTWLPASYHTPHPVVSALFAGLLTKVGVYALIRTVTVFYQAMPVELLDILIGLGGLTALVGALGALAQSDLRRLANYTVVSGIGLMLIGIGLATSIGIEGAIAYALHSILAMTALFLIIAVAVRHGGNDLNRTGGLYAVKPLLAGCFLVVALSTAGLPPFSGFWPKVALVRASVDQGAWFSIFAILASGMLTTIALGRVYAFAFWRDAPEGGELDAVRPGRRIMGTCVAMAALIVVLGLWPRLLFDPAYFGTAQLADTVGYVERVAPKTVFLDPALPRVGP